jgi:hypothetical protein
VWDEDKFRRDTASFRDSEAKLRELVAHQARMTHSEYIIGIGDIVRLTPNHDLFMNGLIQAVGDPSQYIGHDMYVLHSGNTPRWDNKRHEARYDLGQTPHDGAVLTVTDLCISSIVKRATPEERRLAHALYVPGTLNSELQRSELDALNLHQSQTDEWARRTQVTTRGQTAARSLERSRTLKSLRDTRELISSQPDLSPLQATMYRTQDSAYPLPDSYWTKSRYGPN